MTVSNSLLLAHWRMHNLRLAGPRLETPEDVVGWLGAVQSQEYGLAKWSVGARATGISDAALDQAMADGRILRTHVLRPTWHFVLPRDIRWLLQVTAPRVHALNAHMYRQVGMDEAERDKSMALLVAALRGGNQLTRKELAAVLEQAGVATQGFRLAYVLMNAELNGVVCSGGLKGKQHTYALLDERAPQTDVLAHDEALAKLTLRYFTSHGPATPQDFKSWSSLTMADIRKGLEMVGSQLESQIIDGLTFWFAPPVPSATVPSPTVHLLQGYDEYFAGYSRSRYVVDVSGRARSMPGDRPVYVGVVVLDSQVAGHWRRTLSKQSVRIEAALYEWFDKAQTQALHAAADRHGEFLGVPATVAASRI